MENDDMQYLATMHPARPDVLALPFQVLSVHFGAVPNPDTTFEWASTDKHKVFKRHERTPVGFYKDFVSVKADQMVSVINDPRNPYHKYVARRGGGRG